MRKQTCSKCGGSGHMMGGGMLQVPCNNPECKNGFISLAPELKHDQHESKHNQEKTPRKFDRRSKEYKNTIKELMKLGMSEEEAHTQFEKAEKDYNQENEV